MTSPNRIPIQTLRRAVLDRLAAASAQGYNGTLRAYDLTDDDLAYVVGKVGRVPTEEEWEDAFAGTWGTGPGRLTRDKRRPWAPALERAPQPVYRAEIDTLRDMLDEYVECSQRMAEEDDTRMERSDPDEQADCTRRIEALRTAIEALGGAL